MPVAFGLASECEEFDGCSGHLFSDLSEHPSCNRYYGEVASRAAWDDGL